MLLVILALGLLVAPLDARAQPPSKVPRIGVIGERSAGDPFHAAFQQGLRDLGYAEGRNIAIEYRYAHGILDQVSALAAQLVRLEVDVLVVGGTVSAQAAKNATTTVPIVFTSVGDPVGSGLVASLAHPGGNVTGLSNLTFDLTGKQIELLKAAAPQVSRVTVLYNPVNAATALGLDEARRAARTLAVELQTLGVRQPSELEPAFSALKAWRSGAILAISDPVFGSQLAKYSTLAARSRLPAMYARSEFAEAGGLLAYGPSLSENYRRAAVYVDRILKGARPADLPVEQPTKVALVINLKTARALGLTLAPSLLERADQVIR